MDKKITIKLTDKEMCLLYETVQGVYYEYENIQVKELLDKLKKGLHNKTDIIPSYIGCA